MSILKEFLGFGGYQRPAEGYMSWQHLLFVGSLLAVMTALAIILGRKNRGKSDEVKNKVLIISAILIDAVEIFKIIIFCARANAPMNWIYNLPLFLCSIQLITIPLAAFSKGRLKEAALDFVFVFGLLGAVAGTIGAGNNYSAYPVLSLDNVASGITHTISGFASLYVAVSGLVSMKQKNMKITFAILLSFACAAFVANSFTNCNYMFLLRGDGTPYDILFDLVGGHKVIYPLAVIFLFLIYITVFYLVYFLIIKSRSTKSVSRDVSVEKAHAFIG